MHDGPVKSVKKFQEVAAINGNIVNQHEVLIQIQTFPSMIRILEMRKLCLLAYDLCRKAKEDLTLQMILHRSSIKIWEDIVAKRILLRNMQWKLWQSFKLCAGKEIHKKAVYHLLVLGIEVAKRLKGEAVLFIVLKKLLFSKFLMRLQFIPLTLAKIEWL